MTDYIIVWREYEYNQFDASSSHLECKITPKEKLQARLIEILKTGTTKLRVFRIEEEFPFLNPEMTK